MLLLAVLLHHGPSLQACSLGGMNLLLWRLTVGRPACSINRAGLAQVPGDKIIGVFVLTKAITLGTKGMYNIIAEMQNYLLRLWHWISYPLVMTN